jgi:hypothetical protein
VSADPITDDEVLLRRIPPGTPYFEPPDRVTSANFKLRKGEDGISVYRERFVSAEELLQKPDAIPGSFVVCATAGEVRNLKNGKGESLNIDVVPVNHEIDPGHAELRGRLNTSAAEALKRLFTRWNRIGRG